MRFSSLSSVILHVHNDTLGENEMQLPLHLDDPFLTVLETTLLTGRGALAFVSTTARALPSPIVSLFARPLATLVDRHNFNRTEKAFPR